jgi:hypothetical protein
MDFSKIAPYLTDPFVLVGFFLLLSLSFVSLILSNGIIQPLGKGAGASILRIVLHYGFLIGLLIIALAFWYKSKELDQKGALELEQSKNALAIKSSDIDIAKLIQIRTANFNLEYRAADPVDGKIYPVAIDISYPQISGHPDLKIEQKINALLKETAGVNVDHKNENFDHSLGFSLISLAYNTMALSFEAGGVYLGAATSATINKTLSINLKNGEPYQLKDVFRAGFKDALVRLATSTTVCESTGLAAEITDVRDDQEFYVDEGNFVLVYQRREVCAGVDGPTFSVIPLEQLKPIINPNGPFSYVL